MSLNREDLVRYNEINPAEGKLVGLEDLPLFIPAGESAPLHVWLWYPYTHHAGITPGKGTPMNCAGFALFDDEAKYRIDMPAGW